MTKIKINPCPFCGNSPEFDDEDSPFQIWCWNQDCIDNPLVQASCADLCVKIWNSIPNKYTKDGEIKEFEIDDCAYPICESCSRYDYCEYPNKKVSKDGN